MKLIAHRGLLEGPNKELENNPSQIENCIKHGFDVEIDLRLIDGKLFLGHDFAQYETTFEWLVSNKNNLWIHCKNAEALFYMTEKNKGFNGFNFFFHDRDDFTITSKGIIWCYPDKPFDENSIVLMPEWYIDPSKFEPLKNYKCYGICTDFASLLK